MENDLIFTMGRTEDQYKSLTLVLMEGENEIGKDLADHQWGKAKYHTMIEAKGDDLFNASYQAWLAIDALYHKVSEARAKFLSCCYSFVDRDFPHKTSEEIIRENDDQNDEYTFCSDVRSLITARYTIEGIYKSEKRDLVFYRLIVEDDPSYMNPFDGGTSLILEENEAAIWMDNTMGVCIKYGDGAHPLCECRISLVGSSAEEPIVLYETPFRSVDEFPESLESIEDRYDLGLLIRPYTDLSFLEALGYERVEDFKSQ